MRNTNTWSPVPGSIFPWGELIGEQNLGPEALLDTDSLLLRWFNHWLKDSGEFACEPRIRHFALGANRWFDAESFPGREPLLYLHSGGRADSRKGDGVLSTTVPNSDEPRDVFVYDPEVPVLAPAVRRRSPVPSIRPSLKSATTCWSIPALP